VILGGQWRNEIQFGTTQSLSTSFYQPLDVVQRYFVEPKAFWNRHWENVFDDDNNIARYQLGDPGGYRRHSRHPLPSDPRSRSRTRVLQE
jgi:hypothetical protein